MSMKNWHILIIFTHQLFNPRAFPTSFRQSRGCGEVLVCFAAVLLTAAAVAGTRVR
jgi:hypothetical protein